ncbi:MAG: hypothetical protein D6784_14305 [Chloroflexi bacterium]|nr:MAG: hypothetical protein D6784_14305 [Chloroflexota bacterium]
MNTSAPDSLTRGLPVRLLGRLGLLVAGVVIPLLLLEFGVRLTHLAPPPQPNPTIWEPHPLFGWWHIPNSGGIFHSDFNEFETEVRINARGLRDRDIGYDNPTAALRILSLADSFGEALQVNLPETYHKQLETRLSQSLGRPVEVINAGVGGWGTDQEAIFYVAEGFRYRPDVVLLAFFTRNDAVNNYGPLEIARNGGSQQKQFFTLSPTGELIPPRQTDPAEAAPSSPGEEEADPPLLPLADTLWRHSDLYRFAMPYLRDIPAVLKTLGPTGILGGEAVIRARHPATPVPFYVYQSPPDEQFEAAWSLTGAIIRGLRDEVERRGARLVVVIIAAPEQVYPEQWAGVLAAHPSMQGLTWDLDLPNRRLSAILEQEGIPYLDLLPVFRKAASRPDTPPLHFRHDQHWTPAGHRLAAEAIHDFLLDRGLLEKTGQ